MNAIDFLIKEHHKVRKTFAEICDPSHKPETKKKMFSTLCDELIRHEKMEHAVWYPRFRDDKKLDDTVKHLVSEEKHAEKAIKQFDHIQDENNWIVLFNKFRKEVEHHANEEETKLFPKIRMLFSDAELMSIGTEMRQFKSEYEETKN